MFYPLIIENNIVIMSKMKNVCSGSTMIRATKPPLILHLDFSHVTYTVQHPRIHLYDNPDDKPVSIT